MSTIQQTNTALQSTAADNRNWLDILTGPVARIIFGLPFVIFGINHFVAGEQMAGAVPSFIPGGIFWIYLTGAALIAAGVAIAINKLTTWAALGLSAMLASFVLLMHLPGLANEATQQMAMIGLLKDTSLIGGVLLVAGRFGSKTRS